MQGIFTVSFLTMVSRTKEIVELITNSIFPPICYGCGAFGVSFCGRCIGALTPPRQICLGCGQQIGPLRGCVRCVDKKYGAICPLWSYEGPARESIRSFKYGGFVGAVLPLIYFLRPTQLALARGLTLSLQKPILVSVPPHKHKVQRERGFDQAMIIAETLSLLLDVPLLPSGVLIRMKESPSQVSIATKKERQKNTFGAFQLTKSSSLTDRSVIVVDDVLTTGATIRAVADTVYPYTRQKTCGIVLAHEDSGS